MTGDLKLKEVQDLMRRYYFMRDSARGLYATFTWFVEEVGELAEALISNDRERSEEEIADVLAWLASIANLLNIDLNEAFKKKYLNPEPPH